MHNQESERPAMADISVRCVQCREVIDGDDVAQVHSRYSDHVITEHDKPGHVNEIPGRTF